MVASGVIGSIAVAQLSSSKGANRYNLSGSTGYNINNRNRAIVLREGGGYIAKSAKSAFTGKGKGKKRRG